MSLTLSALAQENTNVGRWYQVELILFEQRVEPDVNEVWDTAPTLQHAEDAQVLRQAALNDQILVPLPTTDLRPRQELPLRWPLVNLMHGLEEPLVVLPHPLLQLTGEAQRIHESRGRRVLLHSGWNMQVSGQENTDFIRLHAGNRFGNQYEVDGSVGIYVGRFLHLQTELNITRFELSEEPLPLF
ncbi:MAG: CsiV family protein, partial [Natronospirillum sp.]